MRVSCNGCRVLRKGCSEDCSIRPCLQWLKNPDSQANATVFLAKFYGRAGLMNLVNAGPDHLRPAIFRSLLYEACGRIVNPIYGSVGLLWSGNWQLCQAAVDAVLNGDPILQVSYSETAAAAAASNPVPPLHKAAILSSSYDIRHVSKDDIDVPATSAAAQVLCGSRASAATFVDPAAHHLYKVNKASRNRFKRSSAICSSTGIVAGSASHEARRPGFPHREPAPGCPRPSSPVRDNLHWRQCYGAAETWQAPSHESSAGQASAGYSAGRAAVGTWCSTSTMLRDGDRRENESDMSMVTCSLQGADLGKAKGQTAEGRYVELELTLGLEPVHHSQSPHSSGGSNNVRSEDSRRRWGAIHPAGAGLPYRCDRTTTMDEYWAAVKTTTRVDLRLDLPA